MGHGSSGSDRANTGHGLEETNLMEIHVKFARKNETKNCVRYNEIDDNGNVIESNEATIGTLYIKKTALRLPFADFLSVTVKI
jgi:hypothetical protein